MLKRGFIPFALIFILALPLLWLPTSVEAAQQEDEPWQFQMAVYGWLAGQKGSLSTFPNVPTVDVDVDFWDDVLGNINGAVFLAGEARKGSFGAIMDIAYTDIELEQNTPGSYFSSLSSRTKSWMVTTGGFYRLVESSRGWLDLLAGARYWSVESTLELKSGLLPGGDVTNTKSWIDPVVGAKGSMPFGNSDFFVNGALTFGGFGAGSDFMWGTNLNLGYNWTENIATTIGYRYLSVDYDKDGFVYDVEQHGPTVALLWRF